MIRIIIFHVFILAVCATFWILGQVGCYPEWMIGVLLPMNCILTGMVAGTLYCLRAVYVNRCVRQSWDENWHTWYYLRPITSAVSGFAAYIFLRAGLVILEASDQIDAQNYGYLAFAFIAGLNVDKFVLKLEELAKASFGIEKSRSAEKSSNKEKE